MNKKKIMKRSNKIRKRSNKIRKRSNKIRKRSNKIKGGGWEKLSNLNNNKCETLINNGWLWLYWDITAKKCKSNRTEDGLVKI
jgi:hypothetical protein